MARWRQKTVLFRLAKVNQFGLVFSFVNKLKLTVFLFPFILITKLLRVTLKDYFLFPDHVKVFNTLLFVTTLPERNKHSKNSTSFLTSVLITQLCLTISPEIK